MSYTPLLKHSCNGVMFYICADDNGIAYLTAYEYDAEFPYPQAMLEHALANGKLYLMMPWGETSDTIEEINIPEEVMKVIRDYCGKYT